MTLRITRGRDYKIILNVKQDGSLDPQNLSSMSQAVLRVSKKENNIQVASINLSVVDSSNGVLRGVIPSSVTSNFTVSKREKEDNYILKSIYCASITINFSDNTQTITTYIDDVIIIP